MFLWWGPDFQKLLPLLNALAFRQGYLNLFKLQAAIPVPVSAMTCTVVRGLSKMLMLSQMDSPKERLPESSGQVDICGRLLLFLQHFALKPFCHTGLKSSGYWEK